MVIISYLRGLSVIAPKARAMIQRITIAMEKCAKSIMLCFPLFVKRKCFVLSRQCVGLVSKHSSSDRPPDFINGDNALVTIIFINVVFRPGGKIADYKVSMI